MGQVIASPSVSTRNKKFLMIGGLLLLLGLAVAIYFIFFHHEKKPELGKDAVPYAQHLSELETQEPPSDPLSKAFYYGQIAMSYNELKQYDKSLDNYFKAQKIIDDNGLRMQYAYYQPIADVYKAKGDKKQEKAYLEKHLAYLKEYQEQVKPDDGGTTLNAIKTFEERVKAL
jgi:tetratricopeptide (TPR) repeat protein